MKKDFTAALEKCKTQGHFTHVYVCTCIYLYTYTYISQHTLLSLLKSSLVLVSMGKA